MAVRAARRTLLSRVRLSTSTNPGSASLFCSSPVVSIAAICTFWSKSRSRKAMRGAADWSRIFCKATSDS